MRLLRILLLVISPTAAAETDCGRLSAGDTYEKLNQILECLESKISDMQKKVTIQSTSTANDSVSSEQSIGSKEVESNDLITESNLVTMGQRVHGKVAGDEDRDFYKFRTSSQTEKVRVILRKLSKKGFSADLTIYDEVEDREGIRHASGDTPVTISFESKPDSYYYIVVAGSGRGGEYELVIRDE